MQTFVFAGILIVIAVAGFICLLREFSRLKDDRDLAEDFLGRLKEYVDSGGQDGDAYTWLIHRSPRMQARIGPLGIVSYRPPFENYIIHNYPVILNLVPELRRYFTIYSTRQAQHCAALVAETLIRYIGFVDDLLEDTKRDLRNPVVWFREGVQFVLAIPFSFLSWIGLISTSTVDKVTNSGLFKAISALVSLLSFIGLVVGLIVDWQPFWEIIRKSLGW